MFIAIFAICLTATAVGGLCGIGGGILIKPILDAMGVMPVATVSFLSGITVLAMSAVSVVKSRSALRTNVPLSLTIALSAAAGGILGRRLFSLIQTSFGNDALLGLIQASVIGVLVLGTLLYSLIPEGRVSSKHITAKPVCAVTGCALGVVSSFLGIGGGPFNIILLRYLFGMDAKSARVNSILIILFSQTASLADTLLRGAAPAFNIRYLLSMIAAGVLGGFAGDYIFKRIPNAATRKVFIALTGVILAICAYNCVRFLGVRN